MPVDESGPSDCPRPADQTADIQLHVALARGGDPIRGTLDNGAGTQIDFTGWLELMSAFDTVRGERPHDNPPEAPQPITSEN